jgi:hypothetical protein
MLHPIMHFESQYSQPIKVCDKLVAELVHPSALVCALSNCVLFISFCCFHDTLRSLPMAIELWHVVNHKYSWNTLGA